MDGGGRLTQSEFSTTTKGHLLEADVKLIKTSSGNADSSQILPNVPICIGFGGLNNYQCVVPTATSNTSDRNYTGRENGDYCLVQFIGGNYEGRVITNIWPNPLNTSDVPTAQEGAIAYSRVNGTSLTVNSSGDVILDARNAGRVVTADPDTGSVSYTDTDGGQGVISLNTRSNIIIAAGAPRRNEEEKDLPLGNATLKSSRVLSLRSTLDEIKINTKADADSGDAMQVKIQGDRGSLRPAARENDKIKITDGDEGDLFDYISTLHSLLETLGTTMLKYASDFEPAARASGELINAFIGCHPKPTFQEGKIIEGSAYCKIAGKGNADDIGEDESGIKNAEGEPVSSSELVDMEMSAILEVVKDTVKESILTPNPANEQKAESPGKLNELAAQLSLIPPLKTVGEAIKEASPWITLALEMISVLMDGDLSALPLPEGLEEQFPGQFPSMEEIVGEGGLSDKAGDAASQQEYMEDIEKGELSEEELREKWRLDSDDPDYPPAVKPPINNDTGDPWTWGQQGDDGFPEALSAVVTNAAEIADKLGEVMSFFDKGWAMVSLAEGDPPIFPPAIQNTIDIATAIATVISSIEELQEEEDPTFESVLASLAPILAIIGEGGGIEILANAIVDAELSS